MNSFSDKEYQNLRTDTAEVRACITRYIGYIITTTGFSGALKFFFIKEKQNLTSDLILIVLSLLIITLLFEIIWYKFKSHNRFVGYMQLLMHEIDAIPIKIKNKIILDDNDIKEKKYITEYQKYLDQKNNKGIQDFYAWEFIVSRLQSGFYTNKKDDKFEESIVEAVSKSKFVFTISRQYQPFIKIEDKDSMFFKHIIFKLYPQKKKPKNFLKLILLCILFLYSYKKKVIPDDHNLEKCYYVNGWQYPKKITQIAFTVIVSIFLYSIYFVHQNFSFIAIDKILKFQFNDTQPLPLYIILSSVSFVIFWIYRYVRNLKELIYGNLSIDYNCWMFFIYRTQMLYNRGIIPVYFSRAFIRYFKSNLYLRILNKNKGSLKELLPIEVSNRLKDYENKLSNNQEFDDDLKSIHEVIKKTFKEDIKKLQKNPSDLNLSKKTLRKIVLEVFH
ncbi:hypothetical protein DSM03_11912 [Leeuwenhoekiella aestuarii]|uniref:hypothetical protein n=1 Tax=Leeuwenhoekiella aestuarii TaxID=2249426 RepID=UPI000FFF416B|nr:hypothetical protein [Leeuwenhoekiella aestuarii]RXG11254.1 hypothetical protein DSM03_11912 [Leeuwenhoekiella aestuarii]